MDFTSLPGDQVINKVAQLERRLFLVEQMLVSTAQHADRTAAALAELTDAVNEKMKREAAAPQAAHQAPQAPQAPQASEAPHPEEDGPVRSVPPHPASSPITDGSGGFRLRTLA